MTRAGFDLPDEGQILLDGNDLAATPYIDPQLAANPAIFPTPDVLKRLEYMNDLDHRQRRTLSHIWIEIKVRWISPSGFVDHPGLTYTLNKFRTRQYPTPLDNRTTHYSHRQPGKMLLAACLTGAAACLALAAVTPNGAFLALAAFVLIAVAIAFSSLTIEIDETQLAWHFGPGFIRKTIALADIEHSESIQTRWTSGWGIHRTANGWLYNVAGRGAIIVRLKNTRQFLLGSDEPERLDTALRSAVERLHNA